MNRKGFAPLVILGIVAVFIVAGFVGYFVFRYSTTLPSSQTPIQQVQETSPAQPSSTVVQTAPSTATTTKFVATTTPTSTTNNSDSQIVPIDNTYGLFTATVSDVQQMITNAGHAPTVRYINGGIVATGPYAGYHRIVAAIQYPEDVAIYFLATEDYKTFIIDSGTADFNSNSNNLFNKNKIVGTGDIAVHAPQMINTGDFVLTLEDLDLTPSLGAKLSENTAGFTLYGDSAVNNYYINPTSAIAAYIAGTSEVYAVDASGLAFKYMLLSKEEYSRRDSNETYPTDPNFFNKSEINSNTNLYKRYGQLFPGNCGATMTTYALKNISSDDLIKIGSTTGGIDLYILGDSNHPINQRQYFTKVTTWASDFAVLNKVPAPSYQDYVAKNPVLIFQDAWGRWLGLGEWEYDTGGGCGKPVIYLYPPKPTEVTIKFTNPMRFTMEVPNYANGWNVMAQQDGELTDLQPQFTDCNAINPMISGLGYAQSACKNNDYPYLYWWGRTAGEYPTGSFGWIVPRNNISNFLSDKLTQIGLTDKEKSDMMSYWVPELLNKKAPYFRISFFQTAQMDKFIPMKVSPKPDTVIRVFLDWSPMAVVPAIQPQIEILNHIDRKGFTLVEWGGLKQ